MANKLGATCQDSSADICPFEEAQCPTTDKLQVEGRELGPQEPERRTEAHSG
jgi:hypothetical protein